MEKYKIDPKILENIIRDTKFKDDKTDTYNSYSIYRSDITEIHMMRLDENGKINNPDGCYYFDDPDELIFPKATPESKKELRKAIEANMVPADQKVD